MAKYSVLILFHSLLIQAAGILLDNGLYSKQYRCQAPIYK